MDSVATASDLDFQGDSGGALSIDLDSETLTIAGTSNEIETVGSGNTLTIGLPNDVTVGSDLTVTDSLVVDTSTLVVNASGYTDKVGINKAAPHLPLHVVKTATSGAGAYANTPCMILEDATRPGLQIVGNAGNIGIVQFGDNASSNSGEIYYDHGADTFSFRTAGSVVMTLDSDGKLGVGTTDPGADLEINAEHPQLLLRSSDANGDGTIKFKSLDGTQLANIRCDTTSNALNHFGISAGSGEDDLVVHSSGRIGIGDTAPGTALQISAADAYLTLKNTTAENGEGGAETKIIFEDHADVTLAQFEGSHSGTADDTKGKLILSTHTGSALTAALTIDDTQKATFTGDILVTGTTPTVTIGDGGTEDTSLVFDGNAQDYHVGLDDTDDTLNIGLGSTPGTTPAFSVNSSLVTTFFRNPIVRSSTGTARDVTFDVSGISADSRTKTLAFGGNASTTHTFPNNTGDISLGSMIGTTVSSTPLASTASEALIDTVTIAAGTIQDADRLFINTQVALTRTGTPTFEMKLYISDSDPSVNLSTAISDGEVLCTWPNSGSTWTLSASGAAWGIANIFFETSGGSPLLSFSSSGLGFAGSSVSVGSFGFDKGTVATNVAVYVFTTGNFSASDASNTATSFGLSVTRASISSPT